MCSFVLAGKPHLFIGCHIEYGHVYMITVATMKSIKVKNRWRCQITTLSLHCWVSEPQQPRPTLDPPAITVVMCRIPNSLLVQVHYHWSHQPNAKIEYQVKSSQPLQIAVKWKPSANQSWCDLFSFRRKTAHCICVRMFKCVNKLLEQLLKSNVRKL